MNAVTRRIDKWGNCGMQLTAAMGSVLAMVPGDYDLEGVIWLDAGMWRTGHITIILVLCWLSVGHDCRG